MVVQSCEWLQRRDRTSWLFAWLVLRNICYLRKATGKNAVLFRESAKGCMGNVLYSFDVIFISLKMNVKYMNHKQLEYFNVCNIKLQVILTFPMSTHFISDNCCFLDYFFHTHFRNTVKMSHWWTCFNKKIWRKKKMLDWWKMLNV